MKSLEDLRLDDFRLELKGRSLVPIMQGGMGVNISTAEMAQAVAARGGIGHVSDAMVPDLADRLFGTGFTRMKALACKALERTTGEAGFHFPVEKIREAAKLYLGRVMEGRTGEGRIHVNIMEKLTMNASLETLRARLLGRRRDQPFGGPACGILCAHERASEVSRCVSRGGGFEPPGAQSLHEEVREDGAPA